MSLKPMLVEDVQPGQLDRLIEDPAWWAQLKIDGQRALLITQGGTTTMLNRRGEPAASPIPPPVCRSLKTFPDSVLEETRFDGELVDEQIVVFDEIGPSSFRDRFDRLSGLFEVFKPGPGMLLLPVATDMESKAALVARAASSNREGVVFRRVAGRYLSGKRSPDLLRHKFVREVDCIITAAGLDGKDNVELTLLDPDHRYTTDGFLKIGRCGSIGKTAKPGEVWTVRYLYSVDRNAPRLYQPRLILKREDKSFEECLASQIDNSFTNKDLEGIS